MKTKELILMEKIIEKLDQERKETLQNNINTMNISVELQMIEKARKNLLHSIK